MLVVIVGEHKEQRRTGSASFVPDIAKATVYDDTMISFDGLEQFAYPSLFEISVPIIWAKFVLDTSTPITKEKIQILVTSATIFIVEEFAIPADIKKLLEKHGAHVVVQKKEAKEKAYNPVFSIVEGMISPEKKTRFFAYTKALAEDIAIEALVGVLYWKLRQQCTLAKGDSMVRYKKLYRDFIVAHANAWKQGTPLALVVEKVLLQ